MTPAVRHVPRSDTFTVLALAAVALSATACSTERLADANVEGTMEGARVQIRQEVDPTSLILTDPHAATLTVGYGLIYQARIVDENGQTMVGIRPTWRSTNTAVARVTALPDSAGVDAARATVGALSIGTAMVIASYNGLADTSRITVIAAVDSSTNTTPPGGGTTPVRPLAFDATIVVRGFVSAVDSATAGTQLIPGTTVSLTRLPSIVGDSLPAGVTPVSVATLFGTVVVDANSQAIFRNVPQSRFRVTVTPPATTTWLPFTFESSPPQIASYSRLVTLQKP